jgi:hypothetical protein
MIDGSIVIVWDAGVNQDRRRGAFKNSGSFIILLRPQITMSGAKKIISGTEIIMWHSNHMASLPDLIVCVAEIIMFKPEMTASKPELIISTMTKTASVLDLTAKMANKTATLTEKTATMATKTATIG